MFGFIRHCWHSWYDFFTTTGSSERDGSIAMLTRTLGTRPGRDNSTDVRTRAGRKGHAKCFCMGLFLVFFVVDALVPILPRRNLIRRRDLRHKPRGRVRLDTITLLVNFFLKFVVVV